MDVVGMSSSHVTAVFKVMCATVGYFEVTLNNQLYCCGHLHKCRTYCISTNKVLQFVDECVVCGSCIAQIVKITNHKAKVIVRKKNKQALQLLQRYLTASFQGDIPKGTYANSLIYYNNRGNVFDFNNQKVGTNADFVG